MAWLEYGAVEDSKVDALNGKETLEIPKEVLIGFIENYVRTVTGDNNIILSNNNTTFWHHVSNNGLSKQIVKSLNVTWDKKK